MSRSGAVPECRGQTFGIEIKQIFALVGLACCGVRFPVKHRFHEFKRYRLRRSWSRQVCDSHRLIGHNKVLRDGFENVTIAEGNGEMPFPVSGGRANG